MKGLSYQYSNSLLSLANESGKSELLYKEIEYLVNSEFISRCYLNYLSSPVLGFPVKEASIKKLLKSNVDDLLLKFILFVIKSQRANYLKQIFESYITVFEESKMIKRFEIYTAYDFSNSSLSLLKNNLESLFNGYKILFKVILDISLIGGYVISWDGKQLDCSIKGSLVKLKRELV